MNTPIHDFVKAYRDLRPARFHMPGHKGRGPLGCEELDITEIPGADSLYDASGIIAESEENASRLFGCPTFYSTEGSSHCIRAMLQAAREACQGTGDRESSFRVLAARNVHSTFLSAAALLDIDVAWLDAPGGSYLSADPTPEAVDLALAGTGAAAVYLTCPDYLGCLPDLAPIAEVCHARGALLLVDNAHGAYLRFLPRSLHPMDLGADLCCDSAHKTLPVLTGGAYLHLAQRFDPAFVQSAREALALFGSTSPSYLILQSLDLANPALEALPALLPEILFKADALRRELTAAGCRLYGQEPLKLTLAPRANGLTGTVLAAALEAKGVFCEFSDPDFVTLMISPANTDDDFDRLREAILAALAAAPAKDLSGSPAPRRRCPPVRACSLREAMLSPARTAPCAESLGRILARPGVCCPPAVPVLMPGERIDEDALAAFAYYGIKNCRVL